MNIPIPASLAIIAMFAGAFAHAQTIVAPVISDSWLQPPAPGAPSSIHAPASDIASALTSPLPLLALGPLALRPHASFRYAHSTELLRTPGEPLDTNTQTLSGGSAVELGDHWRANYTANWVKYSNAQFKDGIDQSASLAGTYTYVNWTFSASGAYSSGYPSLAETGYQSRQETLGTGVSAHGMIGQRSFLDLSVNQSSRKAKPVVAGTTLEQSLEHWSARAALGQQITPTFSASVGATFGVATQTLGSDMTYLQPQLEGNWVPTEKITVGAMAGWERRRFRDSTVGTFISPVYSGSVVYHPVETTSFTAGVTQGVAPSYFGSAVTRSTGWTAGLQQRLLQILYGNVGYSQQRSRYFQTILALPQERSDTYDTIGGSLAVRFLSHGSASVFYQRTHNGSNQFGYGFTSTSYGAEVRFTF